MSKEPFFIYQEQMQMSGNKIQVKISPTEKKCWKKLEEDKEWQEFDYKEKKMDSYCLRYMKKEIETLESKIRTNKETIHSCIAYNTHDKDHVEKTLGKKIKEREEAIVSMKAIISELEKK
jgi:hypothetical protein